MHVQTLCPHSPPAFCVGVTFKIHMCQQTVFGSSSQMQSDPIPHPTMNPVWLAQSRLRRRKFDECISICDPILDKNPYDQVDCFLHMSEACT